MKHILFKYPQYPYVNLGDFVQTIAVEHVLNTLGIQEKDFVFHNRDCLSSYNNEDALCIMQGWFSNSRDWIPSNKVTPIFASIHLAKNAREFCKNEPVLNYMKHYSPIGCRDISTLEFIKSHGIDGYFSRCLTITLPKRKNTPQKEKIFMVNVPNKLHKFIPKEILDKAEFINQKRTFTSAEDNAYLAYIQQTRDLLNRYENEATLIITTALHCASPCTAMGIPVVFINPDNTNPTFDRFQAISDIIPAYTEYDLKSKNVDWVPSVPDIEDLKSLMIKNIQLTLVSIEDSNNQELKFEIQHIRNAIGKKRTTFHLIKKNPTPIKSFLMNRLYCIYSSLLKIKYLQKTLRFLKKVLISHA